jgi:hypothetical protein
MERREGVIIGGIIEYIDPLFGDLYSPSWWVKITSMNVPSDM